MRLLRRNLNYANVVATIALFVALGGGAYAATQLPRNSVGTKQLKRGAVTGAKVKQRSLRAADFKRGQLPRGPAGKQGPRGARGERGPQGPAGPKGTSVTAAYATVTRTATPEFLGDHPGFASVQRPASQPDGVYCLTPEPGVDINHPLASVEWSGSSGFDLLVEPLGNGETDECSTGQLEVQTYDFGAEASEGTLDYPELSNSVSFTVLVPSG